MKMTVNAAIGRALANMFPGFYGARNTNSKHDHYKDFGYPDVLTFDNLYNMYMRNGLAKAAVEKTRRRTWHGEAFVLEQERDGSQKGISSEETPLEKEIRLKFKKIRFWHKISDLDRRAMVGGYSGLLLRIGDGLDWEQPVTRAMGLDSLLGVEPVWATQLTVLEWHTDPLVPEKYGEPKMFQFQELPVNDEQTAKAVVNRTMRVHPDRVLVWSEDGTVFGESLIKAGYNDLVDFEKVKGGGGEGFWKNAKSSPIFTTEDGSSASFADMAKHMNISVEDLHDKMSAQVEKFQKGFDQMLMLQGMKAETLSVSLPSPEHFLSGPLQSFAASVQMPMKILVGSQTGERASTEDSAEWDQTIMGRRSEYTQPLLHVLLDRFSAFGILPADKDWFIDQPDLTEAKTSEKFDIATKMSAINAQSVSQGTIVFTVDEIREVVDHEPISPDDLIVETADPNKDPKNDPQSKN